jgi:uncharacterized protein YegP (UPF0339 family)
MTRYQIKWSQYLRSGNDRLHPDAEVMCSGEMPVWSADAQNAIQSVKKSFHGIKIVSIEEYKK